MTQNKAGNTQNQHHTPVPEIIPDVYECSELLADWNQSLLTFYLGRVQQYMKIPFDIHDPTSPEEYVRAHERFLVGIIDDYTKQAEKFLEITRNDNRESEDHPQSGYEASILQAQEDAAKIIDQAKVQAERILDAAITQAEQIVPKTEQRQPKPARRKSA